MMWGLASCLFFFLHLHVVCSLSFNSSTGPSANLCSPEESSALLLFKSSMKIDSTASNDCNGAVGSYPKTNSWKQGSDCCLWDGVTCDTLTGYVIGLDLSSSWLHGAIHGNSSLFRIRHLLRLNLACNDFMQSEIASSFSQLTRLTHLNLSSSGFTGQVPLEICRLLKLVSLDLSYNEALKLDQESFDKLSKNLTELRDLALDSVDMFSVALGSLMNLSSSLTSLTLNSCRLQGKFPTEAFWYFLSLQHLDLSWNSDLKGHLPKSNWNSSLMLLDLSLTGFSGKLPDAIGNLIHLNILNLDSCQFEGSITASISNLTELTYLDVTHNGFTGQIPASISELSELTHLTLPMNQFSGLFPDAFGNLSKVTELDLSDNNFNGQLPSSAFNLTKLYVLDFSENLFEGQIPRQVSGFPYLTFLLLNDNLLNGRIPSWLFSLPSLKILDLHNNKFTSFTEPFQQPASLESIYSGNNEIHGQISSSSFESLGLTYLDLSSNNLSGVVKSDIFSNLKRIGFVEFSRNKGLSLAKNTVNFTLPLLETFIFSSCNLTEFPIFLRGSENLTTLDLSNNKISGRISKWEMKHFPNLVELNLSQNFLTNFEQISSMALMFLDLRSNLLQGPLMVQAPHIQVLLLSNNKLTGQIPSSSLCYLLDLTVLDLTNNKLSGRIPECLAKGEYNLLSVLQLNGNHLEGPLPPSLINCTDLEVLDVGNNMTNDTFPYWLAALPRLKVLILRSNRFHSSIDDSRTRFPFPNLRILDISHNEFTGLLPTRFFENFEAMMHGDNHSFTEEYKGDTEYYHVYLTVKGADREMDQALSTFTTIDLSGNKFQGKIPEVVGKLNSLIVLNISLNNLTGNIPSSLENLTNLESLDFSSNKLSGKIPNELTSLTFLEMLNLSYNQLVGCIPQGRQFDTFANNSYIGNLGLRGPPLSKKCSNDEVPGPTPNEEYNNSSWFHWKAIMMGYGSGLVIGFSMGYIVISTRKPWWFVRIVEIGQLKIVRRLSKR